MDFVDRVAVVTGAASGAGRATAIAFGEAGATVVLLDVNGDGAQKVAHEIDPSGERAVVHVVDMAATTQVRSVLQDVHARFGRLDAVANVCGIYPTALLAEVTEESWDRLHGIDLRGVFFCCQEAIRIMEPQSRGAIVNVASSVAFRPLAVNVTYSAAKAGLVGMSRVLALECAPKGIRVNVVSPGPIDGGRPIEMLDEVQKRARAASRAIARPVTPQEVAGSIVWLCSDGASGVNGGIVNVAMGNYMPVG